MVRLEYSRNVGDTMVILSATLKPIGQMVSWMTCEKTKILCEIFEKK